MRHSHGIPADPIAFIQECVRRGDVLWTYHVNMRLQRRFITRASIVAAVDTYALIEAYPDDKYLPSYLVLVQQGSDVYHVVFAADVDGANVRVVTAYRPDPKEWDKGMKIRRLAK